MRAGLSGANPPPLAVIEPSKSMLFASVYPLGKRGSADTVQYSTAQFEGFFSVRRPRPDIHAVSSFLAADRSSSVALAPAALPHPSPPPPPRGVDVTEKYYRKY